MGREISLYLMNYFTLSFAEIEQAASRGRELLADKKGAELVSSQVLARALIKTHVLAVAHDISLLSSLRQSKANQGYLSLFQIAREKLLHDENFWNELLQGKLSHPPLAAMLDSIDQNFS